MNFVYETVTGDRPMLDLIRSIPLNISKGPWVAGGAVMRLMSGMAWDETSDLDIFCRDEEQSYKVAKHFANPLFNHGSPTSSRIGIPPVETVMAVDPEVKKTNEAIDKMGIFSVKYPQISRTEPHRLVQIVRSSYYKNVVELLEDIDFTICRVATDGYSMVSDYRTRQDLDAKLLRGVVSKRTRATGERMVKYTRLGFAPAPGTMEWAMGLDDDGTKVAADFQIKGGWGNAY